MAVVKPLYVVSGNLQEMDTTKVDELIARAVYQYSLSPSVVLSVVSSGGNLGTISDTRVIHHFLLNHQHKNHKR